MARERHGGSAQPQGLGVVPDERALARRDDIAFFQEVRSALVKATGDETGRSQYEFEAAVRQLVSTAVASTDVVYIFAAACDLPERLDVAIGDVLHEFFIRKHVVEF